MKCSECKRRTRPRKESACKIEGDNPNYMPINDYLKNKDGSFYCLDFKQKKQTHQNKSP